jgi:hypothetical protein
VVVVDDARGGAGIVGRNHLVGAAKGKPMRSVIEGSLKQAVRRRARLRQLQYQATLGGIVCLLYLLLGAAIMRGWVVHLESATAASWAIIGGSVIAYIVLTIRLAKSPDRNRLAAALERMNPKLLDRLNTLIFLQKHYENDWQRYYCRRIEQQTQDLMVLSPLRWPVSPWRPLAHLLAFVLLLGVTLEFYKHFDPWSRLQFDQPSALAETVKPKPDLALPPENTAEQKRNWGEVRINEPGHDLHVTKVDAVPLLIEVATDQSLSNVEWRSALNGDAEQPHPLPHPIEPRYAVYQPVLYLDEFRLADWDVLTYYARAATTESGSYASDVYFLEVRPFREDILKMPGGEGGKSYQLLDELTGLIDRQQHIIRETHRYGQASTRDPQDGGKLASAETDLADASRHVYARISSELENQPIGDVLDYLALADTWLKRAGGTLQLDQLPDAESQERTAFTELVATRKQFQKFVNDHPGAFSSPKESEDTPIAGSAGKLMQIEEFRNETQAAQDFVQTTVQSEQSLFQRVAKSPRADQSKLAGQQEELRKKLEEFQQQHPQPFQGVTNEMVQAEQVMKGAEEALRKNDWSARRATAKAADNLDKLQQALKDESLGHSLTDAYKLKQLLDGQIGQLGQLETNPAALTPEQLQQFAADAKGTTGELKRFSEQQPTRDTFGPPLRDSLTDHRKQALDSLLDALPKAQGAEASKQAAGNAKGGLANISKAFEDSQPSAMKGKTTSPRENSENALERGLDQLQSLLAQLNGNHALPPPDEAKLRNEALKNLNDGIVGLEGHNDHTDQLLLLLDEELKGKNIKLDALAIKKLMDEIRDFSVEVDDAHGDKPKEPAVTHIDPANLPPAYRSRIEKYFQKLSEQ